MNGKAISALPFFLQPKGKMNNKLKFLFTIDFNFIQCYNNNVKGGCAMSLQVIPEWISSLDDEDVTFIKKFILSSGSLKEIAKQYDVTYPTVRLRLDKLIQKIQISESTESEPYIALVKKLAINDKFDYETAKTLINAYKKSKENP